MKAFQQRPLQPLALLLAGCLCLPGLPAGAAWMAELPDAPAMEHGADAEWLAKKGGKGGGGKKGGGSRKTSSKGSSGFKSAGSGLSKGNKQPKGGWSKKSDSKNSPSLKSQSSKDNKNKQVRRDDRLDKREKQADRRDDRLDQRDKNLDKRADRIDDRWDQRSKNIDKRWDNRNDRWDDRWDRYPGWARPGWGYARPWNYGWYDSGYRSSNWGWYGASAAAWGLTTLTTAAIINSAVDNAVSNQTTYVVVPNTDYRLLYGTVEPINDQSVRFAVETGSSETYFDADCNRGTLNGRNPSSASEAELLNAACQVAYGAV
ncbi:hypothetical protein KBY96_09565 [Cyanobium sp. ATX 6A2]|uniref:hypothetical protein n=1 Tax=Cyanobium sp. ATX 6A2 TaxID=2823700 RepID=UPI0020CC82C7|nr:hypothetical protein [Cyanobium sp. ATX 6A2]MCP9888172.1 hypothetical protein [Cyanobium sp. ATX 6A2]